MGPRAVLDAVVKRKIPSPRRESNPRTPIVQPVALTGGVKWVINEPGDALQMSLLLEMFHLKENGGI
jgi:hypothetical protein